MDANKCPKCEATVHKKWNDLDGNPFWLRFNCGAVYERKTDDLNDWICHTQCPCKIDDGTKPC